MLLTAHIAIAIASLAASCYTAVRPSRRHLVLSYVAITVTLASGVMLVAADRGVMLQACVSGLVFSAVSVGLSIMSRRKIAATANFTNRL